MSGRSSTRLRLARENVKALLLIGFSVAILFATWRRLGAFGAMALVVVIGLVFPVIQKCQEMVREDTRSAFLSITALCLAGITGWFLLIGAITPAADVLAGMIGIVTASRILLGSWTPFLNRHALSKQVSLLKALIVFAAASWLSLIPIEMVSDAIRKPVVGRSTTDVLSASPSPGLRIALALSGGGYRAALFHAGVTSEIMYQGIPVDVVSSVSGGSILASALFKCVSPSQFVEAVAEGQLNLTRAIASPRHAIPALWALVRGPERRFVEYSSRDIESASLTTASRTFLQANLLDRTFVAGRYCTLWKAPTPSIEWLIGLTDIRGANLVGASSAGTWIVPVRPHAARTESSGSRDPYGEPRFLKCSLHRHPLLRRRIIAASGAFPGAFEPLVVWESCGTANSGAGYGSLRLQLADGGITDNSGVALLDVASAQSKVRPLAIILASNGSSVARYLGLWPTTEISGDLFGTSGSALGGLGSTVDILHGFAGARFQPRTGVLAELVEISPVSLLSTREPGEWSSLFLFDDQKAMVRFAMMADEDLDRVAHILAGNKSQARRFSEVIRGCIAARSTGGDGCLSESKPMKDYRDTVAGRLDTLLRSFASVDTLQARFSRERANEVFRLGQLVMLMHRAEVESAYRRAAATHEWIDSAGVSAGPHKWIRAGWTTWPDLE